MPAKLSPIYEMYFSFKPLVKLEFAYSELSKFRKDEKAVNQVRDFAKQKSLLKQWKSVAVLRADTQKADFVAIDYTRFACSAKAKKIIEVECGDTLEFLPLEVVGRLEEDDDDELVVKPIRGQETFYFLNPITQISIGKRSKFQKSPACWDYQFCELDENQLAANPVFRLPKAMPIHVTEHFKQIVEKKKLTGLEFQKQRRLDWVAMPTTLKQESVAVSKAPKKPTVTKKKSKNNSKSKSSTSVTTESGTGVVEISQPKTCEILFATEHHKMTKRLWNAILESWNWCCDIEAAREGKTTRPKISKPISRLQLEKLRKKVGFKMPAEFEHVLLNFSRKATFYWSIEEAAEETFDGDGHRVSTIETPEILENCLRGGEVLWDIGHLPEFAEEARNHASSGWRAFKEGLRERLPFIAVGNGDLIAFDMRKGNKNCPVVYLSHENDSQCHDMKLGNNFVDFLANWSSVGCAGPEYWGFEVFYNLRQQKISGSGRNAKRWRKLMATGK